MNHEQFNTLVANRLDNCRQVLTAKGAEYSRDGDRLWNFKQAGRKRNKHPAQSLLDMKVKHDVSVDDIVTGLASGKVPGPATVAEKIGDSINYLLLLEGIIEECRELWTITIPTGLDVPNISFDEVPEVTITGHDIDHALRADHGRGEWTSIDAAREEG